MRYAFVKTGDFIVSVCQSGLFCPQTKFRWALARVAWRKAWLAC